MKMNLEESVKFNWRIPRIIKNISAKTSKCGKCGYDIEIFSDEESIKCPECKNIFLKKDL